jgi:hypothetical protein
MFLAKLEESNMKQNEALPFAMKEPAGHHH